MKPITKRVEALERDITGPAYGVTVTASLGTTDEAIAEALAVSDLKPDLVIRINRFQTEEPVKPEIVGRFSL